MTDINQQQWTDKVALLFHPASLYVGLRSDHMFNRAHEPVVLHLIVTDLDGHTVKDQKVHVELRSRSEDKLHPEPPQSCDTVSSDAPVEVKFDGLRGGAYEINALVHDDKGRANETDISTWVEEEKASEQKTATRGKVLVLPDRKSYKVGDTDLINLTAPFADWHGVMTVRKENVAFSKPISSSKPSTTIELPITSDSYPSVTIQADVVGKNFVNAGGTADIAVPPLEKTLSLTVTPKEKELAPGSDTSLKVVLKDPDGKPIDHGQVALAVVDEALLATASYSWPDPVAVFFPRPTCNISDSHSRDYLIVPQDKMRKETRAPQLQQSTEQSSEQSSEQYSALPPSSALPPPPLAGAPSPMPKLQGATNGTIGPGGAEPLPIALRTNFAELALFAPAIETGADGQAEVKLHLPDSLTRYRIMAVAVDGDGDSRVGSADSTITARLPLMVKPSLPRFLNLGDKCALPVVLQNQTNDKLDVAVGVRTRNVHLNDAGTNLAGEEEQACAGRLVEVPPNDRVQVLFPAQTDRFGEATVQFVAAAGTTSDAAEVSLPVYKPASFEAFAAYGQIDNGAALQKVEAPKGNLPGIGGLSVTTSSTAVQSLADAYFYLYDYKFECSEQLSSRVLAMLSLKDVLNAFGSLKPEKAGKPSYDDKIKKDLSVLVARQHRDGSFALWDLNERDKWPYLSIQVTRALLLAKQRGYTVPDRSLNLALNYIRNIKDHLDSEYYEKAKLSLEAYALYLRYLNKDPDAAAARSVLQRALNQKQKENTGTKGAPHEAKGDAAREILSGALSVESAAWLLPILARNQDSKTYVRLLRDYIASRIDETASTAQVSGDGYSACDYLLFYSSRRESAEVLDCMMRIDPKNDLVPKLAKGLMAGKTRGKWEGTQENAVVLIALADYFARYEKVTPNFDAQVWLGDTFAGSSKFEGRTTTSHNLTVPIDVLAQRATKHATEDLLINKVGPGRLYYRVGLDYVPENLILPAADYGFTVERTFEPVDQSTDVRKDKDGVWHFKAGATVRSKVTFSCLGQRYHVAMSAPLPAGAEPVNPELSGNRTLIPSHPSPGEDDQQSAPISQSSTTTDLEHLPPPLPLQLPGALSSPEMMPPPMLPAPPVSQSSESFVGSSDSEPVWAPWWTWSWFDHQDLRDHEAEAFSALLEEGTYTYSCLIRATTTGDFILPPCRVEEMYMPETFGRTATEQVIVE